MYESLRRLPQNIKDDLKKFKTIPKNQRKGQIAVAIIMNNVYPIIIANSLAYTFLEFNKEMDDVKKWAIVAVIWNLSGFFSRVTHIIVFSKRMRDFAKIEHMIKDYKNNIRCIISTHGDK